jgi:membrane protein
MRDHLKNWADQAVESLPGRCVRRFLGIEGTYRGIVLAGQAFTSLIPLVIIIATVAGPGHGRSLGDRLVERFRLSGESADAMRTLFAQPPAATGPMGLIGLVVLLSALFTLTGVLQRTYEAAWELPRRGLPGRLSGLTGTAVLFVQLLVLTLLVSALRGVPAASAIALLLRLVVAVPCWLVLQYLLLSRRVRPRTLLPGAVVAGAGQVVVSQSSALWMPHLVATNAARYGLIGVTFALLSWLIVIGIAVVGGAVVSAELGFAAHPSRTVPSTPRVSDIRAPVGEPGTPPG